MCGCSVSSSQFFHDFKTALKIKSTKQKLKSLDMVFKVYSKWKTFNQENLLNFCKKSETLRYLKQDSLPLSSLPTHHDRNYSIQPGTRGSFFSSWLKGYFPGKSKTSTFLILYPDNCWRGWFPGQWVWEEGIPFLHLWDRGSSWEAPLRILGPWSFFDLAGGTEVLFQERQAKEIRNCCLSLHWALSS